MTRVVNLNRNPECDIYIGRRSTTVGPWGNKYTHVPSSVPGTVLVGSRLEAVMRHKADVLADSEMVAKIKSELKDKTLGCWCKPKLCHGDIYAQIADEQ